MNSKKEDFQFMQIDIDYYTQVVDKGKQHQLKLVEICNGTKIKNTDQTILRMYGVTESGNSVMAHIYNFLPYFYAKAPPQLDLTNKDLEDIRTKLEV